METFKYCTIEFETRKQAKKRAFLISGKTKINKTENGKFTVSFNQK